MVVGTRFKLGQRGARVGRERRGGLSRDLTTIFGMYAAFVSSPIPAHLIHRTGDEGGRRWEFKRYRNEWRFG